MIRRSDYNPWNLGIISKNSAVQHPGIILEDLIVEDPNIGTTDVDEAEDPDISTTNINRADNINTDIANADKIEDPDIDILNADEVKNLDT